MEFKSIDNYFSRPFRSAALILAGNFLSSVAFCTTYHVKTSGSDSNSGLTWLLSYQTIQKALSVSSSGDEIWVASGTYYPDEGPGVVSDSRSESFKLKGGVALYGGFAGGETQLSQRNVFLNETILSGEIQQDNNLTNNAHHVVYSGPGMGNNTKLNGFIVTAGYSAEIPSFSPASTGAGIRIVNSSPKITLCHFKENKAAFGGGMATDSMAMPEITFCKFFLDSTTFQGGAVNNNSSTPSFASCIFQGNQTAGSGGAVYNDGSPVNYVNCLFTGNSCNTGGAMFSKFSNCLLVNCTFSGNRSTGGGGAMYNQESSPNLFNTISWGNRASGLTNSLSSVTFNLSNSSPTFSHCLLSAAFDVNGVWQTALGIDGGNNLMMDPLFVNPLDPAMAPDTLGDFHLEECSPAINVGENSINMTTLDAAGAMRTNEVTIDLGAYELVSFLTNTWNALGDGVNWNDPMNWLNTTVPTPCQHVLIPAGFNVTLGAAEQGFGKTLQVDVSANLQVDQSALLTIENQ
jgi:hypothetical protein